MTWTRAMIPVAALILVVLAISVIFQANMKVPHEGRWGIYRLSLANEKTELIYSTSNKITGLGLSVHGDRFTFSEQMDGGGNNYEEIVTLNVDGTGLARLTNNTYWDVYPIWSPDGTEIAFLSFRENDMDIYVMDNDGTDARLLFDSGSHDSDINWVGDRIVFTSNSAIWIMNDNGTGQTQVTFPPRAGEWGNSNLPFGDYDPRLSPSGTKIVFERLENDASQHGNYNIYSVNPDGSGETRLTNTGYSQGMAWWSNSGDKLIYIVSAIDGEGKYDIYMMDSDGTNNRNITPGYFPADFLIHSAVFSPDDSEIYFVGEWWG